MQLLTIKEVLALAPGTPVVATSGTIKDVSLYQSGTNDHGPWSLQNAFIEDDSACIPMKIGNQAEIPRTMIGQTMFFCAHKKLKGGFSGLKADMEEWSEEGKVKPYPILAMAKSGEMLTEAQFAERLKAEPQASLPAQTPTPAPVQTPAVPTPSASPVAQAPTQPQPVQQPAQAPSAPALPQQPLGFRVSELRLGRKVGSEILSITLEIEPGTKAGTALVSAQAFLDKWSASLTPKQ